MDRLLRDPGVAALLAEAPRPVLLGAVREAIEAARRGRAGAPDDWAAEVRERLAALLRPGLRPVLNATGVVLHTNLGRAPLAPVAAAAAAAAAAGYTNLEFELSTGTRGARSDHGRALLRELSGAEDALVVNNAAGALLLALAALADGREVVISRGELIEIGGSFRIPDILVRSGARLREVGTTNRTHARDYRERDRKRDRRAAHRPSVQLRAAGLRGHAGARGNRGAGRRARAAVPLRRRERSARGSLAVGSYRRAAGHRGARCRGGSGRSSAVTSSWAGRRPAASWGGLIWWRGAANIRSRAPSAPTR